MPALNRSDVAADSLARSSNRGGKKEGCGLNCARKLG